MSTDEDEALADTEGASARAVSIRSASLIEETHTSLESSEHTSIALLIDPNKQTIPETAPLQTFGAGRSGVTGLFARHSLHYSGTGTQISPQLRRNMLRYVRRSLRQRQQAQRKQGLSIIFVLLLFFGILAPTLVATSYGIQFYATYEELRGHANSGVQHLMEVKNIFNATKQPGTINNSTFDGEKLQRAGKELSAAHADFVRVQFLLDHTASLQTIAQYLPQYHPQLMTARAASRIGIDATSIGLEGIALGQTLAPRLQGSLLADSSTPLLLPTDLTQIKATLKHIQPTIDDIQQQAGLLSLDTLPLSDHLRSQLQTALQMLPSLLSTMKTAQDWVDPLGWFLGVDGPRTFLVQTMDRGELRATGGFTGQYGELQIKGGRMTPPVLQNIALLEYADGSSTFGQLAPEAYRSWWPFANWGLRDANLSADFPTSARLAIDQYQAETKRPLDGVMMFSPFLIKDVLKVIGPITIPSYNETITAQNLEERLHFYQLNHDGIVKEKAIEHVDEDEEARKLFTARLAHTLIEHVRQASPTLLLSLGQQMLHDMQSRDLELYANDPQLEMLLIHNDYASQLDRSTTHDGLALIQANVSASKASQYVRTIVHDTVNLDTSGGATHLLQIRLAYTQIGDVYGLDTYRDYLRIYVPPTAQFRSGTGFDNGVPLCSGPLPDCPADSIYPHDELVCPTGSYHGGAAADMLNNPYNGSFHPLDEIGPPTTGQSDEPERAMFGGYVVIPKNCLMTVTVSWYIPPIQPGTYQLLFQRQTGTFPALDLTVLPPPTSCANFTPAGLHFNGVLENDRTFNLKQQSTTATTRCDPPGSV